jgi:hypothetical protein
MRDPDKVKLFNHTLSGVAGTIDLNLEEKFADNLFKQVD